MYLLRGLPGTAALGRGAPDCIALVDCNNFYVSCERKFDPKLNNRAVVVLSSNDGCVIARSEEAKAIGIPMGAPLFKYKKILKQHNAAVISANFIQYAQISTQIIKLLELEMPKVEVYSVDEAWLDLSGMERFVNREQKLKEIRAKVLEEVGMPISIGFSTTKVLAKLANRQVKKSKNTFVNSILTVGELQHALPTIAVGDIWGIGRQLARKLRGMGIHTAHQLVQLDEYIVRKKFHLPGWHLWRELQGIPTLGVMEAEKAAKTILVSRSFGRDIYDHSLIEAALITFVVKAAQKLWAQKRLTRELTIFVYSNGHKEDIEHYDVIASKVLENTTDFPPTLIQATRDLVASSLKTGIAYKKAGICLTGLTKSDTNTIPLFDSERFIKRQDLRKAIGYLESMENENPGKSFPLEWAAGLAARQEERWHPLKQYTSNLSRHIEIPNSKRNSKPWW